MDGSGRNQESADKTRPKPPSYTLAFRLSLLAITLAIWPELIGPAKYDPTIAVLTATLVGVIWYAAFTYELLRETRVEAAAARRTAAAAEANALFLRRQTREQELHHLEELRRVLKVQLGPMRNATRFPDLIRRGSEPTHKNPAKADAIRQARVSSAWVESTTGHQVLTAMIQAERADEKYRECRALSQRKKAKETLAAELEASLAAAIEALETALEAVEAELQTPPHMAAFGSEALDSKSTSLSLDQSTS